MAKGYKTGGRSKGTPNKATQELREALNDFIESNIERIKTDFESLEPKDRVKLFSELLQYVLPKYQAIQTKIESDTTQFPAVIQLEYVPAIGAPPPLREEPPLYDR